MTEKTTKEINDERRAALYNIKAVNTGFNDYFGRDIKKEKELEIERQKLDAVFKNNKVDIKLAKPGEKKK